MATITAIWNKPKGDPKKYVWEVVLYQRVHELQHYCKSFKYKRAAMEFARLNQSNPAWGQIWVHPVLASLTHTD